MTPVEYHGGRVRLYPGDCLETLKGLPSDSVDAVVTDPPYALVSIVKRFGKDGAAPAKGDVYARASAGFMSQRWDTGEVAFAVDFWREVFRVLRPGGFVSAFGGTRTYHQLATAIEGAGFEIRDRLTQFICSDTHVLAFLASLTEDQLRAFVRCIEESQFGGELAYVFGVGFPKNHNTGRHLNQALGWWDETELERGEMAMSAAMLEGRGTAIKPAMEPICLARKPMIGTVVENVLVHGTGALNIDECRIEGQGNKTFLSRGQDGRRDQYRTGTVSGCVSTDLGRWPANVLHDCSDEVIAAFPAEAGAFAPVRGSEPSAVTDAVYGARGRAAGAYHSDSGSAARFYYGAKADADDRIGSRHPTVKDPSLMAWVVRLTCPPGGTVLDMFAGTGTTGEAALREGRKAILCEREPAYLLDIARRMDLVTAGPAIRKAESAKARNKAPKPAPLFGEP